MPAATTTNGLGQLIGVDLTAFGMTTNNGTVPGPSVYGGSGVPSAGLGVNGDYYYRSDTPQTVTQRLYVKSAGSWIATAA